MIKDENFCQISGWMINNLDIKGTDLICYAIIYGFSQAKGTYYTGSAAYLAEWTKTTVRCIRNSLKALQEKGYIKIIKIDDTHSKYKAIVPKAKTKEKPAKNGEKVSLYNGEKISPLMVKKFHHNGEKISPNNNKNNINNINKPDSLININNINKADDERLKDKGWLASNNNNIPSLEEVKSYVKEQSLDIDSVKFFEKNQERGWITKQGQPIKRWKSLLWVWAEKEEKPKSAREDTFEQNDYDFGSLEEQLLRR